ncbi:hypothetical protein SEUCBS139899_005463 [Sporothrix eucalyptigena]
MCRGVVNVYGCRHREVGQIHMCNKAYSSQNISGCWPSLVYCLTGIEPRRQCSKTTTDRRYVGEPCWSCSRGLSQPLERSNPSSPSSSSSPLSLPSQSRSPPLAPKAYMPEAMMSMANNQNPIQTPTGPPAALVISPPTLVSSSNYSVSCGIISLPSVQSNRPLRPQRSFPTRGSNRPVLPPSSTLQSSFTRRTRASDPLSSSPLAPQRPTTSRGRSGLSGSSTSPLPISRGSAAPPLTRPRPTLPSSSSSPARFASPSSSQSSFSRPRAASPPQPKVPVVVVNRTPPLKTKTKPSLTLSPSAAKRPQKGIVSRLQSSLRSPKSTESFACAESRKVERAG